MKRALVSLPTFPQHELWWQENSKIVLHAICGGPFLNSFSSSSTFTGTGSTKECTDITIVEKKTPSLKEFRNLYCKDAIYEDLFIAIQGQRGVLQSFRLIGQFWNVQVTRVDSPRYVNSSQQCGCEPKPIEISHPVLRIPYQISQRPVHFPFSFLVPSSNYCGWVDLHLRYNIERQKWQIAKHDDRIEIPTFWKDKMNYKRIDTEVDYKRENLDILSMINESSETINWAWSKFRRMHGICVGKLAEWNTD